MDDFKSLSERLADKLVSFYLKNKGKPQKLKDIEEYFKGLTALNNAGPLSSEEEKMVKAWKHVSKLNDTTRYLVLSNALGEILDGKEEL